ncbi:hypothetical protein JOY44_14495 [Phormidium sp. CLA17]|uniref:hypothetical protein n=1 Tax=Leptolyngbya sp. Cla-17 TaxID=2803751 RepID=UPI0014927E5D|nr:hypothetical protein [Leptolyngbya sp. Cla-17]MBM0742802.1 hypothetical protein [Leptolyngbya sp. Cla-17]
MQSAEFLTPEECAEVDKALLTSHDKFTTRVTIYALRSLKQIAQKTDIPIATLQSTQIEEWVYQDESLQKAGDSDFRRFFSQLVISSLKPLKRIAREADIDIERLTIAQVIIWFEKEAKKKLEKN